MDIMTIKILVLAVVALLILATLAGELRPIVGDTYPLEKAPQAQIDLRARRTTGKLLLDPTV